MRTERDFTIDVFRALYRSFVNQGYEFITFSNYCLGGNNLPRFVILRHDVDRYPRYSLKMAEVESKLSVKASYYFRIVKSAYDELLINRIAQMGHEIGYHYEDLSLAKGNYQRAIEMFSGHLNMLREFYPVKTICMHGSPLSPHDNLNLWNRYDYHDFGILGEPYIDIDFNEILYLTDTGRCWNSKIFNIRDKVDTDLDYDFRNTDEIINTLLCNGLPDKVMINIHPHRWTERFPPWLRELMLQNTKNLFKGIIVKIRK